MPIPEQPKDTRTARLLDADRLFDREIELHTDYFGSRIVVDGVRYDHCSTAPDGAWEFEPMK